MYEIRDERGNALDSRPMFDEAEQCLDEICRQAAAQAAANGEGTSGMTLSWTIVNTDTGELASTMTMTPDVTGNYESIIRPEDAE